MGADKEEKYEKHIKRDGEVLVKRERVRNVTRALRWIACKEGQSKTRALP